MSASWTDGKNTTPTADNPDLRVLAAGQPRSRGLTDLPIGEALPEPSIKEVVKLATSIKAISGCLLSGGETTLRPDLPALLEKLSDKGVPRLGIHTDGLALASEQTLGHLRDCGLQRLRVPLHSARADAHDWVVGLEGAAKRVIKTIRMATATGLEVEIEVLVTRPTAPYLEELVELLARLRVETIHFRRLTARGACSGSNFVTISPRFGLTQNYLEAAVRAADSWGVRPAIHLFPMCSIAGVAQFIAPIGSEKWVAPKDPAWQEALTLFTPPETEAPCRICPGDSSCMGPPQDYLQRFGRVEIDSQSVVDKGDEAPTEEESEWSEKRLSNTPPKPPVRAGRTPATRTSFIWNQIQRELYGDPMSGMERSPLPPAVGIFFEGPSRVPDPDTGDPGPLEPEPARVIRVRMVRLSQEGPQCLRIASAASLAHPDAPELLRDATRLSIPIVEIAGEASALSEFEDVDLRRLRRRIARFDVAFYGPDEQRHDAYLQREGAFALTLNGVERLQTFARVTAGAYAIIHSAEWIPDYARAWEGGSLPGSPVFRLSSRGASLDALADAAREVGAGPCQDALARVLPPCLLERDDEIEPSPSWETLYGDVIEHPQHSGSDWVGRFAPCASADICGAANRCPGLAEGWTTERVAPLNEEGE